MTVLIVDTGLGNVAAVRNMFTWIGIASTPATTPPNQPQQNTRYFVPGVGSYDEGVRRLQRSGWFDHLCHLPAETPVLGVCLGMQLLGLGSEEGTLSGLNRVDVTFRRFHGVDRVPHMGWNDVQWKPTAPAKGRSDRFYFTHSYYGIAHDPDIVIGTAHYGQEFVAAFKQGGTIGVQFHPEKSHRFGRAFLQEWYDTTC